MACTMNKKDLKRDCVKNGLYSTPAINDKLYLHYKGYNRIENLEEYTGLKALWLEGNGFTKIEGLEAQTLMRSLYLQENVIDKIEGLESLTLLDSLNLSKNFITKIENLGHMKELTSLNLAHNKISSVEGIRHLLEIPSLQSVDLQHNKLEDAEVLDVFEQMPDLRVLYLMGNNCVKNIKNYRRAVVSRCKQLKYLDERPVFEEERRRTDAWAAALNCEGGSIEAAQAAEREELDKIREEKRATDDRNHAAFTALVREGVELRRAREGAGFAGDSDSGVEEGKDINPFSGETIVPVPENPELTRLREERWGAKATAGADLESSAALQLPLPPAHARAPVPANSARGGVEDNDIWGDVPLMPPSAEGEVMPPLPPAPPASGASRAAASSSNVDLCELD
jgi:dynein assembly factor 1